jgi:hemoglobin/transferrin/lactoferrin receptor protein
MKNLFFLCFLLVWTCTSYSQTVTIIDLQTQLPLEGATLISENAQSPTITDAKGQADISAFKNSLRIQIRSVGFELRVISYDKIQALGFKIGMESSKMNLSEVVVSATRWQQTSGNIPSKIISISPKEVALQNPQTAADLLGISGKVFIQKSQQGGGSPMIRGFATNRLIYTVDGVRMNTAIFRGGNIQNVISLDPFATENTEVLFGPGSVIYGSDAVGGVMSFQTLTPTMSLTDKPLITGKAVTRYASANKEKTGHFDVNVGWEKWAMVTSFSSWDYDHLRQGSKGPDDYIKSVYPQRQNNMDVVITQEDELLQIPSAYSQINFMQKVRFKPNRDWDFQYGFHLSETSPYGRYDRHNRLRNGTIRYAEWDYGPQKWMMNNLNITHTGKNKIYDQISLRLAQQSFEESRIDRTLNRNDRNTNVDNVEVYSANLDFTKSLSAKNTFYYGFEVVHNDVTSAGNITDIRTGIQQAGPARYPNATWSSMAAYINDEWRVSDKFTIQGSLRYNYIKLNADFSNNLVFFPFPFTDAKINNRSLTGSIGGVYRPTTQWAIRANFGTAFRSPNVDDVGKVFDLEPGAVVVPNLDLEAEYAYNVDFGVAKVFDDWLKVDVTGFYTTLKNALVRRNFQLNGLDSIVYDGQLSKVQAIQNAAVANVYGVQAGVEIKFPSGFTFLTDLNYQVGEEELNNGTTSASRHAAPFFGVSRLRYKYDDLTLELNSSYQAERSFEGLAVEEQSKDEIYAKDKNGRNYSPSWYTLNLKVAYQLNETFNVSGGVENITDRRYRPFSSGLSGAGRNFMLALRVNF